MIGEFDYDSLFFDNSGEEGDHSVGLLPYRTVTLFFFLGFMMIVPIVIMNLLVRLFTLYTSLWVLPENSKSTGNYHNTTEYPLI